MIGKRHYFINIYLSFECEIIRYNKKDMRFQFEGIRYHIGGIY